MAKEAGQKALADAGISYKEVQQAAVGYCYGDSTCGQRALYQLGMTGIPIYNVKPFFQLHYCDQNFLIYIYTLG